MLVRRMLTVQDRAAIAKGLREGCLLRRAAGRIVVDRCRWYLGRYAVTVGSVGISRWQLM